jgi:hypothetical protein
MPGKTYAAPDKDVTVNRYSKRRDAPPDFFAYPRIAAESERVKHPETILVHEVGLMVADDPDKYALKETGARSKDRDNERDQQEVVPRDAKLVRVIALATEFIPPARQSQRL